MTDAELVCLAVAQVLLRYDDERHWPRAAPKQAGHLFPRLLGQSEYNDRVKALAPLMEAALRWLADHTPASTELLRLMDATPIPCGRSVITARRSELFGYGYCPSHSRWSWGAKLMIICTCEGTVTGFCLANPKLYGERDQARQMLKASQPPGTAIVTDKGLSGEDTKEFFASPQLGLELIRSARKDDQEAQVHPELAAPARRGDHLDAEEPARSRTPRRPRPRRAMARIVQRLLALNAAIWHNWQIGAPVKRSLIAYAH